MTDLASVLASVPPHEYDAVVYADEFVTVHLEGCKRCLVERVLAAVLEFDDDEEDKSLLQLAHEAGMLKEGE